MYPFPWAHELPSCDGPSDCNATVCQGRGTLRPGREEANKRWISRQIVTEGNWNLILQAALGWQGRTLQRHMWAEVFILHSSQSLVEGCSQEGCEFLGTFRLPCVWIEQVLEVRESSQTKSCRCLPWAVGQAPCVYWAFQLRWCYKYKINAICQKLSTKKKECKQSH